MRLEQSRILRVDNSCFNPRTPGGMRRLEYSAVNPSFKFQSTHSGGNATKHDDGQYCVHKVSIHALRGECDLDVTYKGVDYFYVSIHALRGECDKSDCGMRWKGGCFNPRTPGGMRLTILFVHNLCLQVSIHALRGECDTRLFNRTLIAMRFQSTHSGGNAT